MKKIKQNILLTYIFISNTININAMHQEQLANNNLEPVNNMNISTLNQNDDDDDNNDIQEKNTNNSDNVSLNNSNIKTDTSIFNANDLFEIFLMNIEESIKKTTELTQEQFQKQEQTVQENITRAFNLVLNIAKKNQQTQEILKILTNYADFSLQQYKSYKTLDISKNNQLIKQIINELIKEENKKLLAEQFEKFYNQ